MLSQRPQLSQTVSAEILEDRLNMYINAVDKATACNDQHESSHLQRDIQILMDLMEKIHTGQVVTVTEVPPPLVPPPEIDVSDNISEELRTRLLEYHKALYFAEEELSEDRLIKVQNLQRGLQTIHELQRRAQAGVPVRADEIPPQVAIPSDAEFDPDAVKTLTTRLEHLKTVLASETNSKKVAKLQSVIRKVEFLLTRAKANRPVWIKDIPLECDYPLQKTKRPKVPSVNKAKLTLQLRSLQQRLDSILLSEESEKLNELKRKMKALEKELPHIKASSDVEGQLEFLSQEVGMLEQAVFAEKAKVFTSVSDNLSMSDTSMPGHKVEDLASKLEAQPDSAAEYYKVFGSPSQKALSIPAASPQLFPVDIRNSLDTDEDKLSRKLFSYSDKGVDHLSSSQQLLNLSNKVNSQRYLSKVQNAEMNKGKPVLLKNSDVGLHNGELNLFKNRVLPDSSEKNIANPNQHQISKFKDNSLAKDFSTAFNMNDHKGNSALDEAITDQGFSISSSDTTLPSSVMLHQNPFTIALLQDKNSDSVNAAATSLSFHAETVKPENIPFQLSRASVSNVQLSGFIPQNVDVIMGHNQMLPYSSAAAFSADDVPSNSVLPEGFRSLDVTSTASSDFSKPDSLFLSLPNFQTFSPDRSNYDNNQSYGTICKSNLDQQQKLDSINSENYLPINKLHINNDVKASEITYLDRARSVVKSSPETLEFQDLMRSMSLPSETLAAPSSLSSESFPPYSEQVIESLSSLNLELLPGDDVSLNLNPASDAQVSKNAVLTVRLKSSSAVQDTHTFPLSMTSSQGHITTGTFSEIKTDPVTCSDSAHSGDNRFEILGLDYRTEELHLERSTQDISNPQILNGVVTVVSEELPKDQALISSAAFGEQPPVKVSTLETATISQASVSFEYSHIAFTCLENLKYDYLLSRTKTSEESRLEEEKIKTKLEQIKQVLRQGGRQTWEVYKACVERELASINQQIEDVRLLQQWADLQMLTEKKHLAERELTVLRVRIPNLKH